VRVNVEDGLPWALGRLFLTLLIVVDPDAKSVLSVHKPEMRISVKDIPEIDTGGERWISNPG